MSQPITADALQAAAASSGFGAATMAGAASITLERYSGTTDIMEAAREVAVALGMQGAVVLFNTLTGPAAVVVVTIPDPDGRAVVDIPAAYTDGSKPRAKKE